VGDKIGPYIGVVHLAIDALDRIERLAEEIAKRHGDA
jgi:hypothetical protein